MGIFDALFGKKSKATPDEAPVSAASPDSPAPAAAPTSAWIARRRSAHAESDFDWDWGNSGAHALAHFALKAAAPHFGGDAAKIKEVPDDENIDLRGMYEGVPIRFAMWMSFGSFWAIELRVPQWAGYWQLHRDHEKIPKHGDADDPWAEDEDLRIFVAKGIFFEGDEEHVRGHLELWGQLDEASRQQVVAGLERLDCTHLLYGGKSVALGQHPGLDKLDDPTQYMRDCAELLHGFYRACDAAKVSSPQMAGVQAQVAAVLPQRVTCGYCTSLFFLSPGHTNCPNCGAAPKG